MHAKLRIGNASRRGTRPGDQWAANVTNVVKPTRFQSPRESPCYKHRQSTPKTAIFSEKALGLTTFVTTRTRAPQKLNTRDPHDAPGSGGPGCGARGRWRGHRPRKRRARLRCPWAVAGPSRASRRHAEPKARSADGERAGRRPRAHKAARPHAAPGTPVGPQARLIGQNVLVSV